MGNDFSTNKQDIADERYWTVEEILERVPQEEIFRYYLGIRVQIGTLFCSPLRQDEHPTCSFKWFGGKLRYRDWSEPRTKDCFDIVQEKYMVDFRTALQIIAEDFGLSRSHTDRSAQWDNKAKNTRKNNEKTVIQVKTQSFTKHNLKYLQGYYIPPKVAKYYNVYGVKTVWVKGNRMYSYTDKDPVLGYYFGTDEEGHQKWKLYFYERNDNWRFIGNTNRINGWVQIPKKGKELVITKSLKDVMCLSLFKIPAIAMQAETQIPYDYIIKELKQRYDNIYTLLDFDRTGVTTANEIRKRYSIRPLFLTNGRFNSDDFEHKDFSDFLRAEGKDQAWRLIDYARQQLTEQSY